MPFDPRDNLRLARDLDSQASGAPTPSEAALRVCYGRAYYSAFLVVRERLARLGFVVPQEGSHQWVAQKLKTSRDNTLRSLGMQLAAMRHERHHADYDLQDQRPFAPGKGHVAAVRAEQWIRTLDTVTDSAIKANVLRP